jgi:hypothetical protein
MAAAGADADDMINGKRYFDAMLAQFDQAIPDCDDGESRQRRVIRGEHHLYLISSIGSESGDHELIDAELLDVFSGPFPKDVENDEHFLESVNKNNCNYAHLTLLLRDHLAAVCHVLATDEEDLLAVNNAYYLLANEIERRTDLAALQAQVEQVLREVTAGKLQLEQDQENTISWQFQLSAEVRVYFLLCKEDLRGHPFLAIQTRLTDIFFYEHALAQNIHKLSGTYRYDHAQKSTLPAEMHVRRTAASRAFRLAAAFHFNQQHAWTHGGLRMLIANQAGDAVLEQRIPLVSSLRASHVTVLMNLMALAWRNKLYCPEAEKPWC